MIDGRITGALIFRDGILRTGVCANAALFTQQNLDMGPKLEKTRCKPK
jgi:hypothetical protein